MPNKNFSTFNRNSGGGNKISRTSEPSVTINERVANFGGLPGKAQSKNRSGGTTKLKVHPQKEGL